MIYPPLFKKSTHGKINKWTVEVEENKFRTISGYSDGVQTTSEWTICEGKNIGKKNETTPEQQAKAEADALYRKRKEVGYFEDINKSDVQVFFQPMLAKNWNDEKSKVKFPLASQPKLDGIRALVKSDGMWSRTGKLIVSAPHIFEALKPLFEENPDLIFDGELYADKFANDFNAICSIVKKTKPTPQDLLDSANVIQYHIYDLPSHDGTFVERFKTLSNMNLPACCVIVPTEQVDNENDLTAYYEDYVTQGYEGQMLRVLDSLYESKRSKFLLKHKSFIDEEYTILDIVEGIGNKTGMVGSFVFQNKNGKRFNASPKFSHDICKEMWNNRNELIGKDATVKYFNLTPDGVPRFGYVIKIAREDYE
jgi:ATP-dependent DNA ligase